MEEKEILDTVHFVSKEEELLTKTLEGLEKERMQAQLTIEMDDALIPFIKSKISKLS